MASKKKEKNLQEIPSDYTLIAADLSLKRPGFCTMRIHKGEDDAEITIIKLSSVDNKTKTKPRGELLQEIAKEFNSLLVSAKAPIFLVREQSINNCGGKSARSGTAARTGISSVVGVMDLIAWQHGTISWDEYYPVTIKKILTGCGKAEKKDVASALDKYIGEHYYKNDDESDAAAVAVAWLIDHNQIKQISQEDTTSE